MIDIAYCRQLVIWMPLPSGGEVLELVKQGAGLLNGVAQFARGTEGGCAAA
ncbi:hypothetical protein [Streptomyces sp. NPDC001770]